MTIIDRTDIETWGLGFDAKGIFPKLIGKLIFETSRRDTILHFASGSEIFSGGWDGVVTCHEAIGLVPEGISLWEIGTNGTTSKANNDYTKRTNNPLSFEKKDCTFIFATTAFWDGKEDWVREKKADNEWKDVKVYDSSTISSWLEKTPVSARWFATYYKHYPYDAIFTAEESWKMFCTGPKGIVITPNLVTAGRSEEIKLLETFLAGSVGLIAVRAQTKDEAIAFVIASAMQFVQIPKEIFFSRTLVVDSFPNFHGTRINKNGLNIIAKLDDSSTAYTGVSDGHHIILPLGPDDQFNSQDIITLPRIEREGQIEALKAMGLSREDAEIKSRESGRDLTVLKKLLGFPPSRTNQIILSKISNFIPALLVGRWSEQSFGDKLIIEHLSGERYDDYIVKLNQLLNVESSPLIKIGEKWRLASPLDAWTNFSSYLSNDHLRKLEEAVLEVLSEVDPALEIEPDKRYMASIFGKKPSYSGWLKEGLSQTLILVTLKGQHIKIKDGRASSIWVDSIISILLKGAKGELWASLNPVMPLLAEAAPIIFMDAVGRSLLNYDKNILKMFEEEDSMISPSSRHTGLLWALESLAWDKDYFHESVMLLAKLSDVDPGGKLINRPFNSLKEIFKPWHYQTFAPYEQRIRTLEVLFQKHRDVTWRLASSMLPEHHGVGHNTHKMRWRLFEKSYEIKYTWEEIQTTHSKVLSLLMSNSLLTTYELNELVESSDLFLPNDRNTLIEFISEHIEKVKTGDNTIWQSLRKLISHHSEFPNAEWALQESELKKYRDLYNLTDPKDEKAYLIWLFSEHWPIPLEDQAKFHDASYEKQQEIIDSTRSEKVKAQYNIVGLQDMLLLIPVIKEHWAYGSALAKTLYNEIEIDQIILLLKGDSGEIAFANGFLSTKRSINGLQWGFDTYNRVLSLGLNSSDRAKFLVTLPQEIEAWIFIGSLDSETEQKYWIEMSPWFWRLPAEDRIHGIRKLMDVGRYITAMKIAYHNMEDLPSSFLIEILHKVATIKSSDQAKLQSHEIHAILGELDKRADGAREEMFRLEWLYLPLLSTSYSQRHPIMLEQELTEKPAFFVEMLRWIFLPEDDKKDQDEITDEALQERAKSAFNLLSHWKKIPGANKNNEIDSTILRSWIEEARRRAIDVGRLRVADAQIGRLLAQFPETGGNQVWPPIEIAAIIDELNTDSLKNNFSAAIFNKRGSSTRGAFDGGDIERGHSLYFKNLAIRLKDLYPVTSSILNKLSENYLADAKRVDEVAEREKLDS